MEKGLTQNDIAQILGYGSSQIVSNWERGLIDPPTKILRPLVRILDIDENEVINLILASQREFWSRQFSDKKKAKQKKA
jgi:transcriptional regulator with XRE-family HTH domain